MKRLLACAASAVLLMCVAVAQREPLVTVRLDRVPVKEAIARIVSPKVRTVRVKPEVKGTVTLTADHEPLGDVLYKVMRQVHAIYDYDPEEGTYDVRPMATAPPVRRGTVIPEEKLIPAVDYSFVDVRLAIEDLLTGQVNYTIPPEIKGTVAVNLRNVSLKTALLNVLYQVDCRYRMTANGIEIMSFEDYKNLSEGPPPPLLLHATG
jgi:type II secretory pathway component GspD/PulD (secretin)